MNRESPSVDNCSTSSLTAEILRNQRHGKFVKGNNNVHGIQIINVSCRKQKEESQQIILQQLHDLLKMWHRLDSSMESSQEIFNKRFGIPYTEESQEEFDAQRFKNFEDVFAGVRFGDHATKEENEKAKAGLSNNKLKRLQQIEQERLHFLTEQLYKELGWAPTVRYGSQIAGANERGLFLKGSCKRGTVVGIYPGLIYNTKDFRTLYCHDGDLNIRKPKKCAYIQQLAPGLYGTYYIDGQLWEQPFFCTSYNHIATIEYKKPTEKVNNGGLLKKLKKMVSREEENEKTYGKTLGLRFIHPFAQLNMVNHLPCANSRALPNLIAAPFSVPLNFDPELLPYIPNKYYSSPTVFNADFGYIRTVVYIATRDINNEELSIDYRWNPQMQAYYQSWYRSNNEEQDERLWSVK
jgi:hypothetical protein